MEGLEERLEAIESQMRYLMDRQEIEDVIHGLARATDRFDVEMMTDCFTEDGFDDHGTWAQTPAHEFAQWANRTHSGGSVLSLHNICTHGCEIDGDVAHAESYVMGAMLDKGGETCRILNGRYLDRLERREGRWAIALRRCTVDVVFKADASIMASDAFRAFGMIKSSRDKLDPGYARPLTMDTPVERW